MCQSFNYHHPVPNDPSTPHLLCKKLSRTPDLYIQLFLEDLYMEDEWRLV